MKRLSSLLAAVACVAFAVPVLACDQKVAAADKEKAGGCGKSVQVAAEKAGGCGKSAQLASDQGGCCKKKLAASVAKVMDQLPRMNYRVGDFTTPCHETALSKAGCPSKIKYVVGDTTYDTESAATVALADLLEKEAESLMAIRMAVGQDTFHCPMAASEAAKHSGQKMTYRLAGVDFMTREDAEKVAKLISQTMSNGDSAPVLASAKAGCSKPCGGDKAKLASTGEAKPSCAKAAAAQAKAEGTPPCHAKAAQAAAEGESATVKTVASEGGCCKKAAERLAQVEGRIRTIVETAAAAAANQGGQS